MKKLTKQIQKDYFESILIERFLLSFEENLKIYVFTYGRNSNLINPRSKIDVEIKPFDLEIRKDIKLIEEINYCFDFIKGFFNLKNYEYNFFNEYNWDLKRTMVSVRCRFIY